MSINALTSKDTDKGWANLYVNTLTAYNGIFGNINGDHTVENLQVTGNLEVDGLAGFKEDVLMNDVLRMTTGHIVSADGQNHPWFVRQQDVQNGDGGTEPTGLMVSDTNQSGYKQLKTFESAEGGYVHYGGEDNRIITYHTASDVIDEGIEEEGLVAKSASGGITARGLEPQDFHASDLLQNPGVLKSVAANDRHELQVEALQLTDIDTTDAQDGEVIAYDGGLSQLRFVPNTLLPTNYGHAFVFSRRPIIYTLGELRDLYLGGIPEEDALYPAPEYGVVRNNPTCQFSILDSSTLLPATSAIFTGANQPPTPIVYRVQNTVNPSETDRFLVKANFTVRGAISPATFTVVNNTMGAIWSSQVYNDLTGVTRQYEIQGVFGNNDTFQMSVNLATDVTNPTTEGLRVTLTDTHITKIA